MGIPGVWKPPKKKISYSPKKVKAPSKPKSPSKPSKPASKPKKNDKPAPSGGGGNSTQGSSPPPKPKGKDKKDKNKSGGKKPVVKKPVTNPSMPGAMPGGMPAKPKYKPKPAGGDPGLPTYGGGKPQNKPSNKPSKGGYVPPNVAGKGYKPPQAPVQPTGGDPGLPPTPGGKKDKEKKQGLNKNLVQLLGGGATALPIPALVSALPDPIKEKIPQVASSAIDWFADPVGNARNWLNDKPANRAVAQLVGSAVPGLGPFINTGLSLGGLPGAKPAIQSALDAANAVQEGLTEDQKRAIGLMLNPATTVQGVGQFLGGVTPEQYAGFEDTKNTINRGIDRFYEGGIKPFVDASQGDFSGLWDMANRPGVKEIINAALPPLGAAVAGYNALDYYNQGQDYQPTIDQIMAEGPGTGGGIPLDIPIILKDGDKDEKPGKPYQEPYYAPESGQSGGNPWVPDLLSNALEMVNWLTDLQDVANEAIDYYAPVEEYYGGGGGGGYGGGGGWGGGGGYGGGYGGWGGGRPVYDPVTGRWYYPDMARGI